MPRGHGSSDRGCGQPDSLRLQPRVCHRSCPDQPRGGVLPGQGGVAWLWWALRQGGELEMGPRAEMVSGGCDEEAALSVGHRGAAPG